MKIRSVRSRLALLYAAAVMVLIGIYSAGLYYLVRQNLLTDMDRKLRDDVEAVEMMVESWHNDSKSFADLSAIPTQGMDANNWLTEVWSSTQQRFFTSGNPEDFPLGLFDQSCGKGWNPHDEVIRENMSLRVFCIRSEAFPDQLVIRVARLNERISHQLSQFLSLMAIGAPLIIFLAGGTGYLLARKALAPISAIVEKAKVISAERLSERLPIDNPEDELGELAQAFNKTFERLESSFEQMKRFTSDASHEMRTPLAAVRAIGEIALREPRSADQYQETISSVLEETARLQGLCESLLLLSRADSGAISLSRKESNLFDLLQSTVQVLEVLAEEKSQKLVLQVPKDISVSVDVSFFRQALMNLIDNAIKYSPSNTEIGVRAKKENGRVFVSVHDNGPGISSEHQHFIFDRFYRVDSSRSREKGGAGLGLAIVSWIVRVHGGSLTVRSEAGKGSVFEISLSQNLNGGIS